ncbi:MAG: hypothetical protein ASARMPRED_003491 [Alectoria sarmentosa]|nr:MAG: hypothetical protein ASARMPRED_003491 [Alectoria sarmentosa]
MASSPPSPKTKTEILPPAILAESPHLPALVKLLNYTYDQSHIHGRNGRLLPPDPSTRLKTQTQLSDELEPDGFTILMFSSEQFERGEEDVSKGLIANGGANGTTLIATVSAKPYEATKPEGDDGAAGEKKKKTHLLFKRPPPPPAAAARHDPDEADDADGRGGGDEGWPQWEILAMAVHPRLQGRGLASTLLGQAIDEVKIRAAAASSLLAPLAPTPTRHHHHHRQKSTGHRPENGNGEVAKGKGKVMLMLSTMLELNESFYLKRGFTTTAVRRFEPGTMGSVDGFSAVEMMRWVDL